MMLQLFSLFLFMYCTDKFFNIDENNCNIIDLFGITVVFITM